jgi:phosphate transport system permease protein
MSQAPDQLPQEPSLFNSAAVVRARVHNKLLDRGAQWLVAIGGIAVIGAVLLIAVYLLYEVVPMFKAASVSPVVEYALPMAEAGASIYLATEEQAQVGFRLTASGDAVFFSLFDGLVTRVQALALPAGVSITSVALDTEASRMLALGLSNGSVLLIRHSYRSSYPNDRRVITPVIEYPYGRAAIEMFEERPLTAISVRDSEGSVLLVAQSATQARAVRLLKQQDFMGGEVTVQTQAMALSTLPQARKILLSPDQRWLYLLDTRGRINVWQLSAIEAGAHQVLKAQNGEYRDIGWLLGDQSLISLSDAGLATQWFMVREQEGPRLTAVRQFQASDTELQHLAVEQRRKGFLTLDAQGKLSIFNTTADRRLLQQAISEQPVIALSLSPRANALLLETSDRRLAVWEVDNQHPDVSWRALWGKVWYESYAEPEYIWQSSAANTDFEPKLSLMPLAFGTLKAAFYAMLIATPLALGGAIFTAYFMAPAMRAKVKPLIELMEALPTVILGFLAGLWLAPFMEGHMIGVLMLLLVLPVAIIFAAFLWYQLPLPLASLVPQGWQAAMLIPVVLLTGYLCFALSPLLEQALFEGDFLAWLTQDLGVGFDQRNALVVGIAMGFAVIPTIFSIAEDAIFSVPRQLTMSSLALGATPWQAFIGVVLPTASPGIFSALMIGFGRAVGETMIVLMATGNTPIMDVNIFEGMRTLAANIAVEVPEAEVASTHYRVLFLAAFVLFSFTFVFNTLAEIIRQSMREKYGNL